MWLTYVALCGLFMFLSQLSGLPQAMFYHLHWAVALPMAFMGFLVLIPGLIKEIIQLLIWPFFRPFVQLLIEAAGFVKLTSEDYPQARDASALLTVNTTSTITQFILAPFGLCSSKSDLQQPDSSRNSPAPSSAHRPSPNNVSHLSPRHSPHHSPRLSPRHSPRKSPAGPFSSSRDGGGGESSSPLRQSRLSSLQSSARNSPRHHRSPARTPRQSPRSSPYRDGAHGSSPDRTPMTRSPDRSRPNSPSVSRDGVAKYSSSSGNVTTSRVADSTSPSASTTASLVTMLDEYYWDKWRKSKKTVDRSVSSSDSEEEVAREMAKTRIQKLRQKKLEEQYEMAIRTLTPVIREHVRKHKSASPEKRPGKQKAQYDAAKIAPSAHWRKKSKSESEKRSKDDT